MNVSQIIFLYLWLEKIFYFEKRFQSEVLYWISGGSAAGVLEGGIDLEENSLLLSECGSGRKNFSWGK
jgi:hypothetical protein